MPQFVVCCFPAVAGGGLISNLGTFVLITSLHCLRQPREHYQVTLRKRLVSSWKIQRLPPPQSSLLRDIAATEHQSTIFICQLPRHWREAGCEEGWVVVVVVLTPGSFSIVQKLDMDIDFRSTF